MLEAGDVVEASDEIWDKNNAKWIPVPKDNVGRELERTPGHIPSRRLIPNPSAPVKPFTPNKYTRDMPTLDGRTVPVDVYCVSQAFRLSDCLKSDGAVDAANHARKKMLAPGQRGTKTAIQDLKEARASLDRAIQLEEAVGV